MQTWKLASIFVVLLCSLAATIATANAQIIISEVYPAPGVGESEWIELYNTGENQVDLTGFALLDQLSSPSLLYTFLDQLLAPNEYLLVDLSISKLNNSGDGVELRDAESNPVDLVMFEAGQTGKSWQRTSPSNAELVLADPSPETASSDYSLVAENNSSASPHPITSPTPTPLAATDVTEISLQAISACPSEGKESLSLLNSGNDLYLDSWQVIDAAGNQKLISGLLPAGETVKFDWTGSLLNNSGDSLELVTDEGILVASAEYNACTKGIPLTLTDGAWLSELIVTTHKTNTDNETSSPSAEKKADDQTQELSTNQVEKTNILGSATSSAQLDQSIGEIGNEIKLIAPTKKDSAHDPLSFPELTPIGMWPAWGVIMGGLLQLLPSGYLLYAKFKLISLPPPIFP